jgi:hypothetical protein
MPDIDKKNTYIIRKRITISTDNAIYVFVHHTLPPTVASVSTLYDASKDADGFLHVMFWCKTNNSKKTHNIPETPTKKSTHHMLLLSFASSCQLYAPQKKILEGLTKENPDFRSTCKWFVAQIEYLVSSTDTSTWHHQHAIILWVRQTHRHSAIKISTSVHPSHYQEVEFDWHIIFETTFPRLTHAVRLSMHDESLCPCPIRRWWVISMGSWFLHAHHHESRARVHAL